MNRLWWATLSTRSPRYAEWRAVLDTDEVPLVGPNAISATLEGIGKHQVYLLDLNKLSSEQRDRLVLHVAKKFRVDPEQVAISMRCEGFPIREEDVIVAFSIRAVV